MCPAISFAQSPYQFPKYEEGEVLFDKVYDVDSLTVGQIETLLADRLPGVKNLINFNKATDQFTEQLNRCYIDIRRNEKRTMTNLPLLDYPMTVSVSAFRKDGKYRIVVDRMQWITDVTLTGEPIRSAISAAEVFHSGKKWRKMNIVLTGGKDMEQYLSDLFDFTKKPDTNWQADLFS